MRLKDVNVGRLSGLKYKLTCHFKLAANIVGSCISEIMYNADGSAFLKRKLMGVGVYQYRWIRFHNHTSGQVSIHMF